MKIFFDFETTSLNPHEAEIIEGYFEKENGESLHIKAKPEIWSDDAALIHRISKELADTYPPIQSELRRLCQWLPKEFSFVCFANVNTPFGCLHYDLACLRMAFYRIDHYFWFEMNYSYDVISVHTIAKQILRGQLINYSQKKIADHFGIEYDAHNCVSDVKAMIKIYNNLINYEDNERLSI